jgi:ATP-dependent helicase YprA (DUF1998 family)
MRRCHIFTHIYSLHEPQAQTGSGKTLVYSLPVLSGIDPSRAAIQAVVVVPSRELGIYTYINIYIYIHILMPHLSGGGGGVYIYIYILIYVQ